MKTKAILILICIGMLTSCAGKFSVMKRRYNKGYYVSHSGDRKQQHKPEGRKHERLTKVETTAPETFAKTTFKQDPDLQASSRVVNELPASAELRSQDNRNQEPGRQQPEQQPEKRTYASTRDVSASRHEVMALSQQLIGAKKDLVNSGADSDVNLVLLVILAILIPPLAVYLKNKTIDKWFWITLILSILGFFGFFFIYGGLFWLAAAVIAILYVLDAL